MTKRMLFVLLLLLPGPSTASLKPLAGPAVQAAPAATSPIPTAAANAAIAAQAEADVAAGQPVQWLITFRAPEEQVVARARIISQSAGATLPQTQIENKARRAVYSGIKARVLGPAAQATSAAVIEEAGAASPQQQQGSVQIITDYHFMPITYVSISSAAELERLRSNPDVLSVMANGIVRPMSMNAGLSMIGQPAVIQQGLTGDGIVVVVDTGLDYTRDIFGPCTAPGVPAATCRVAYMQDITAVDDGRLDDADEPHGTNVAGIIATVAPGVKLISLDIFDPSGDAQWSTVVAAINWAVANKAKYNVTAINLSLGGGSEEAACDSHVLAAAVNTAYDAGILSAAAAGNAANANALIIPACASKAVSVGAVYTAVQEAVYYDACTDAAVRPDTVACFSNSAPMLTILAPGCSIDAAGLVMSGTSQATPFVAAAIAVLRNRFPAYTLPQVVSALTSTGVPVTDPRNKLVRPRLNLQAAAGLTDGATQSCTTIGRPKVTPNVIRASSTGGTHSIQVTPPEAGCAWTVEVPPTATWVRVVGSSSGTGPGAVTLQVDTVGATARSSGVAVTSTGLTTDVLLSQAAVSAGVAAIDMRPPVMGLVKGTAASGSIRLNWPTAKDSQSGVSSYTVVYNQGSRPPNPRCTSGTAVSRVPTVSGSNMWLTVPGLSAGSRYTFRVCALDAAGNVGSGSIWRGTAS